MQWLSNLFKPSDYTSEIDALLIKMNGMALHNTPGKTAKTAYFKALIKQRDLP
jgi:hypothetical protein